VKWAGRCGECQAWGTVVEAAAPTTRVAPASVPERSAAQPITGFEGDVGMHWPSGIDEFDRVLGGGVVPGSVILLSRSPPGRLSAATGCCT
jgi:DNA repair protein RadA/Sms